MHAARRDGHPFEVCTYCCILLLLYQNIRHLAYKNVLYSDTEGVLRKLLIYIIISVVRAMLRGTYKAYVWMDGSCMNPCTYRAAEHGLYHYRNPCLHRVSRTLRKGQNTFGKKFTECHTRQTALGKHIVSKDNFAVRFSTDTRYKCILPCASKTLGKT